MKKIFKMITVCSAIVIIATSGLIPVSASGLPYDVEEDVAISAEIQGAEDAIIAEYEAKAAIQREATQAYAALFDTFGVTEDGETIHPNDYAGAWIDGSTLHVALTSLENTSKYDSIFSGFDCVVYEKAEYSLNELQKIQDTVYAELSTDYDIVTFYTDVETNKIVFEAEDELEAVETKIVDSMSDIQTFGDLADNATPISDDLFVIKQGERIRKEASLRGGMEINRGSASGPGRTISVCGTIINGSNTYNGIVTAGHNLTLTGTNQTLYRAQSEFGTVNLLMYKENGNGDWAVVKITNSDTITNKIYGSSSVNTRDIKGTKDDLAPGTIVMKYGMNSGYATGKVEAQNVTINDGTYTIKGMTRCSLESGASTGGDSGGPYYIQNTESGYNYVGTHEGSSGSGDNQKIYFTPYVRFKTFFSVKTS